MKEVQKITVEKIYNNRKDPKSPYKSLQLRVERDKVSGGGNFLNQMLVGGIVNTEKLVTLQTMHDSFIEEFGVTEGCDLNEKLRQPGKLVVSEITASEFDALESGAQIPYSPKINPASMEFLVDENGEYIHRGILFVAADSPVSDKYIKHAGSVEAAPEVEASADSVLDTELPA